MSVKAIALVWELECPKEFNGVMFKPSHKFVLVAYADHADHSGKNIYPAIGTISKKTGLDPRSVQRLTHECEQMGILVNDGQGPRGTNRWYLSLNQGGDKLSPLTKYHPDKNSESLGDIPSGDIPSGDNLSPELKEPKPLINLTDDVALVAWQATKAQLQLQMARNPFELWVQDTQAVRYDGNTLTIGVVNEATQAWLESRLTSTVERLLIGILNAEVEVKFVVAELAEVESE